MGIADLPDISDDDWLTYQADTFRRQTQPLQDSLLFQQQTLPQVDDTLARIQRLAAPIAPPAPMPSMSTPMQGAFPNQGAAPTSLFPQSGGAEQVDPASLSSMLSQYPDEGDLPQQGGVGPTMGPPGPPLGSPAGSSLSGPQTQLSSPTPLGPPGPEAPGFWSGIAPDKPNIFSWAGEQAQQAAQGLRSSGATQTPLLGGLLGGGAQYAADALANLGGTSQALRRGDIGGAAGGILQATVGENTPLGIGKNIATEAQWPTQIFPGIDPNTPVIGGLNNPREMAGLAPQLLLPETALERGIGGAVGRAISPATKRIGEVASPYVEQALSGARGALDSLGRGAEPAFGIRLGEDTQTFHGSGTVFNEMRPGKGMLGDVVYLGSKPEVGTEFAINRSDAWTNLAMEKADYEQRLADFSPDNPSMRYMPAEEITRGRERMNERLAELNQRMAEAEQYGAAPQEGMGANVRPVTMPKGMNIWDSTERITPQEARRLLDGLAIEWRRNYGTDLPETTMFELESEIDRISRYWATREPGEWLSKKAVYDVLAERIGEKYGDDGIRVNEAKSLLNDVLRRDGFDGISYRGFSSLPVSDAMGNRVPYTEYGIFPASMSKLRNTLSGTPGGIVSGGIGGRYYHGTSVPFDRAKVPTEGGRSYALPGYYASPDPNVAGNYAGHGWLDEAGELSTDEGAHIRSFELDPDTNLLETRRVIPENEVRQIVEEMNRVDPGVIADEGRAVARVMQRQTDRRWGSDKTAGIRALFTLRGADSEFRSVLRSVNANADDTLVRALQNLGYDGVRADEAGEIISLFDTGIAKAKNTLSGRYGGITPAGGGGGVRGLAARAMTSPFFSPAATGQQAAADITLGAAGGAVGAATADEDATWQERVGRGVAGAAIGGMLGPVARAPKGIAGIARGVLSDEEGALKFGAAEGSRPGGRLDPPADYTPEDWAALSRAERRRINYAQKRGEYASKVGKAAGDEATIPDYGSAQEIEQPLQPPLSSESPQLAQQEAYEDALSRMTERGVPEDEADESAYFVGRDARREEAERISDEADQLYDEEPDLRADDDPEGGGVTATEEIRNLTNNITPVLRVNPVVRGRQERFIGTQEGLPGIAGTEARASLPGAGERPAYDAEGNFIGFGQTVGASSPEAVVATIADRTGSAPVGTMVTKTLKDAGIDDPIRALDPDNQTALPSWLKEAIGREDQVLANDPPEVRDYVDRVINGLQGMFKAAHGARSDAELEGAVEALRPFAIDLARSADPGSGLTSDTLVVLMHQGVEATSTPAMIAYDRLQQAVMQNAPDDLIARLTADYDRIAAVNNIYLAGLEAYSSAAGRALRANRADVYQSAPFIPEASGGSIDAGDPGRAQNFGKAEPALEARDVAREEWNVRQRAKRQGGPLVDRGTDWNSAYWQRKRDLNQAADQRRSGRRINGPLENEGLLWTDLFVRDDPSVPKGTALTENERLRWLFGLDELKVPKGDERDSLYRTMSSPDFDPDDTDAVLKFWAEAARVGGAHENPVAVLRPSKRNPNKIIQTTAQVRQEESPWKDGINEAGRLATAHEPAWMKAGRISETLPRDTALNVAKNALTRRLEAAQGALEKARRDGITGDIKRYNQAVAAAQKDMPKDMGGADNGLFQRFHNEYPPDYESTRTPGDRGKPENVNLQTPAILTKKVELLNQLDSVDRGTQLFRGGLSVVTSNMLTSARMIEASAMESGVTMLNKLYTQAVWRNDREGARQIAQGMWMGATPAWNNLLYAFKNGMGPMEAMDYLNDVAKKGAPAIRSTPLSTEMRHGIQSGWLAPMHRISRAMQEFFTTLTYYGELNRLAHERVSSLGEANALSRRLGSESRGRIFAGDATRIADNQDPLSPGLWFHAPDDEMRNAALKEAMTIASGGPHSTVAKWLADTKSYLERGTTPGGKAIGAVGNVIFPFVYGIDFSIRAGLKTAVGPVMYPVKAGAALARGDTAAARAYGTNAMLTLGADLFIASQVLGGNLTGKGPADARERQALLERTDEHGDPVWRPDSMRVPLPNGRHLWLNYGSLPIVGVTGAIMANAHDAWVYDQKSDDSLPAKVAKMMAGTIGTVAEGTYFRDMMDLVSIFSEPQTADQALSRFGGGLVGRIVPAAMRQLAQGIDPHRKAPENALQEFAQNIPGLRNMVPNQVSPFTGEDVNMGWSPASLVAPGTVYYGSQPQSPIANETDRLNRAGFAVNPSQYSATQQGRGATIMGNRQTGEQVRATQGVLAEETQRRATMLLASPQYQAMTTQQQAAALDAVFTRSREASDYDWQSGLTLSPQQQLTRAESAVQRYEGPGLAGLGPSQLARRNEEISQAKALLTQYNRVYGEDMGEVILRRQNRQAWRDAVMYEDVDPDLRWMRERRAAQGLGLDPRRTVQPGLPGAANALPPPPLGIGQVGNTAGVMPSLSQLPDYSFSSRFPPSTR